MPSEPCLGEVRIFAFNFAPRGWAFCDGQLLPIAQNTALFSLLGTIYGGDGRTTFALPDLRGRFAMHEGDGPGRTNRRLGASGGDETATLSVTQIPAHNHILRAQSGEGNQRSPGGHALAMEPANVTAPYSNVAPDASMVNTSIQNTGGGQAHSIMNPFLVLNFCIALQGLFPSRS